MKVFPDEEKCGRHWPKYAAGTFRILVFTNALSYASKTREIPLGFRLIRPETGIRSHCAPFEAWRGLGQNIVENLMRRGGGIFVFVDCGFRREMREG